MRYRRNWIVPKGKELTDMDRKILFYQEHGHLAVAETHKDTRTD